MNTLRSLVLSSVLCLSMAACAQPTNRPTPTPDYSFQGTVYAPAEQDVAGTVVVACYPVGEACDENKTKLVEITQSGANAPFRLEGLENASYDLYAVKDVNGDGDFFGAGDYYGDTGSAVTPPRTGVSIQMAVLGDGGPIDPGPGVGEPEPYVVKGRVTDARGNPLPSVQVFADNTAYYDMNVFGTSDANGYYRIELGTITPSSWRVGAHIEREFAGERFEFRLHADDDAVFAGVNGALRNLEWRISGEFPGGGHYGSLVYVYTYEIALEDYHLEHTELTFVPDGPLVDGSAGQPFTRSLGSLEVADVPIGRYTVTARYAAPGKMPTPLLIRPRFQDSYATSATLTFKNHPQYGTLAELELSSP